MWPSLWCPHCGAGDPWVSPFQRLDYLWFPTFSGFPGGSDSKESACTAEDLSSIPLSGRSLGEGNGNPLQYSCLENSMDRGTWWATVHGVAKSQTRLSMHTQRERLCIGHRPRNVSHHFCSHFIGKNLNTRLRLKIQSPAQRPHTCLQLDYHLGRTGK